MLEPERSPARIKLQGVSDARAEGWIVDLVQRVNFSRETAHTAVRLKDKNVWREARVGRVRLVIIRQENCVQTAATRVQSVTPAGIHAAEWIAGINQLRCRARIRVGPAINF